MPTNGDALRGRLIKEYSEVRKRLAESRARLEECRKQMRQFLDTPAAEVGASAGGLYCISSRDDLPLPADREVAQLVAAIKQDVDRARQLSDDLAQVGVDTTVF